MKSCEGYWSLPIGPSKSAAPFHVRMESWLALLTILILQARRGEQPLNAIYFGMARAIRCGHWVLRLTNRSARAVPLQIPSIGSKVDGMSNRCRRLTAQLTFAARHKPICLAAMRCSQFGHWKLPPEQIYVRILLLITTTNARCTA